MIVMNQSLTCMFHYIMCISCVYHVHMYSLVLGLGSLFHSLYHVYIYSYVLGLGSLFHSLYHYKRF